MFRLNGLIDVTDLPIDLNHLTFTDSTDLADWFDRFHWFISLIYWLTSWFNWFIDRSWWLNRSISQIDLLISLIPWIDLCELTDVPIDLIDLTNWFVWSDWLILLNLLFDWMLPCLGLMSSNTCSHEHLDGKEDMCPYSASIIHNCIIVMK